MAFKLGLRSPIYNASLIPQIDTEDHSASWVSKGHVIPKSLPRVRAIYAGKIASRGFFHQKEDGIHTLLKAGFVAVYKEALELAQKRGKAYILLNFLGTEDLTKEPPSSRKMWSFGNVVSSLPNSAIHADRYILVKDWRNSELRMALREVCKDFDRAANTLIEFLENVNKTVVYMGEMDSIKEFNNMPQKEREQLKALIPAMLDDKYLMLGKNDKVENIVRSEHVAAVFPHITGVLSMISGIPLSFFFPGESGGGEDYTQFYNEIETISDAMTYPVIERLFEILKLTADWTFRSARPISEKDKAEATARDAATFKTIIESLKTLSDLKKAQVQGVETLLGPSIQYAQSFLDNKD
jgi:hypothetical protein